MTEEAADAESGPSEETEAASATAPSDGEEPAAETDAGDAATERSDAESGDGDATGETETDRAAELADRAAEYDEDLAAEVRELAERTEQLEAELREREEEVDDLTARLKRKQADFQNYKKRAKKRQEQLKERATEDLVERLVTVRDNLLRALDQGEDADVADIRGGVESTLKEFDRVLEDENVEPIEPEPGEEVDPHRHEVMMRVDSDQPEGTVASLYQPGYEMGEKVIRAAQVTVSDDADE